MELFKARQTEDVAQCVHINPSLHLPLQTSNIREDTVLRLSFYAAAIACWLSLEGHTPRMIAHLWLMSHCVQYPRWHEMKGSTWLNKSLNQLANIRKCLKFFPNGWSSKANLLSRVAGAVEKYSHRGGDTGRQRRDAVCGASAGGKRWACPVLQGWVKGRALTQLHEPNAKLNT